MIGSSREGKTYLAAQMIRELGERYRGKKAVLILGTKGEDDQLIYPGAIQGEIIREPPS